MKKILKEYRLEIAALVIALLGIFLVSQRGRVETFLKQSYFQLQHYLNTFSQIWQTNIVGFLRSLSLSELIGWMLVLLAIPYTIYRVRYRFTESEYWRATVCPKCGGELQRIPRNLFDRLLSRTLMPSARRYSCGNTECNWSGLRRRRHDQISSPLQEVADLPKNGARL